MSFEGLQERLTALQETTNQLRELIDRLSDLKFQPGSVPLDTSEEGSVSGELSAEITQLLRDSEDENELLQEEVELVPGCDNHQKTRLREGLERHKADLDSCRLGFRRARLAAKKSLTQAQREERELMIRSYSLPVSEATSPQLADDPAMNQGVFPPQQPFQRSHHHQKPNYSHLSQKDKQAVGASHRVNEAMQQMHASIQAELERSQYAKQTLEDSSAAFKQLDDSYGSLDTILSSSRDLVGTLMKSHKSDTWYLTTALYMLMTTAAWLVFRRWLYGPLWWFLWLPLRLLFGVGSKAGSAVMSGSRGQDSGRVEVGSVDGKVPIEGIPDSSLPTAQVGQDNKGENIASDPDSMVEKVGKIVDAAKEADELGNIPTDEADKVAEQVVGGAGDRLRDEL